MTLPSIFRNDKQHWQKLHDQASTGDGKAIVGALMILTTSVEQLYDAIHSLQDDKPFQAKKPKSSKGPRVSLQELGRRAQSR